MELHYQIMKGKTSGYTLFHKRYLITERISGWNILNKPFQITFTEELLSGLYSACPDDSEIGGVFIAHPDFTKRIRTLEISKGFILKNQSQDPLTYEIDDKILQDIICDYENKKRLIVPITFHTHPAKNKIESKLFQNEMFEYYRQTIPSGDDKVSTYFSSYYLYEKKYSPPDILVVKNYHFKKLFLGYYDFMNLTGIEDRIDEIRMEAINIIVDTAKEIKEWMKAKMDTPWKKFLLIVIAVVGIGFLIYLYRKYPNFRKVVNEITRPLFGVPLIDLVYNFLEIEYSQTQSPHPFFKQTRLDESVTLLIE